MINMQADSLYSLNADGRYRATLSGRNTWKSLTFPQAYLQPYCNKEGFNIPPENDYWKDKASKVRIGIVANNNDNCRDVDSRIGFVALEGHTMTITRVESIRAWLFSITEKDISKAWDTSLCSDEREELI